MQRSLTMIVLSIGLIVLSAACFRQIDRSPAQPTNLPTATASMLTISPTETPSPTTSPTIAAHTPTPTATPRLTLSPTLTSTPHPTETPTRVPTATATSISQPSPTTTPTFTSTPTPSPTPSPSPTPTATPTQKTPTPAPASTATPVNELVLAVLGPTDGSTVLHNAVVVFGLTSVGALVTVNDIEATVAENGAFQAEIELAPGENEIEVIGRSDDAEKIVTLTVTSLALPPLPLFLVVTEPTNQSIVAGSPVPLSGRTSPDAIVSVNGVSVPVDGLGIFSTTIRLDVGPNIIDVVATDATGKQLSVVVALIFRPREQ